MYVKLDAAQLCSAMICSTCTTMQGRFPAFAEQWDSAKNGVVPDQVFAQSTIMAFWKDKEGRTWEQTPFVRVSALNHKAKRASYKSKHEQEL